MCNTFPRFTDEAHRLSNKPRDTRLVSRTTMGWAQICLTPKPTMPLTASSDSYSGRHCQLCDDSVLRRSRADPGRSPSEVRILFCNKWNPAVLGLEFSRAMLRNTRALAFRVPDAVRIISSPALVWLPSQTREMAKHIKRTTESPATASGNPVQRRRGEPMGKTIHFPSSPIHIFLSPLLRRRSLSVSWFSPPIFK